MIWNIMFPILIGYLSQCSYDWAIKIPAGQRSNSIALHYNFILCQQGRELVFINLKQKETHPSLVWMKYMCCPDDVATIFTFNTLVKWTHALVALQHNDHYSHIIFRRFFVQLKWEVERQHMLNIWPNSWIINPGTGLVSLEDAGLSLVKMNIYTSTKF